MEEAGKAVPKAVPKGTAFEPESAQLSVLSYNLLAPIYVRPIDRRTGVVQAFAAFDWAEPAAEVLEWGVRWPRLLAELRASAADIICLQEVQFERGEGGQCSVSSELHVVARVCGKGALGKLVSG